MSRTRVQLRECLIRSLQPFETILPITSGLVSHMNGFVTSKSLLKTPLKMRLKPASACG
jgi:hypothetical protein